MHFRWLFSLLLIPLLLCEEVPGADDDDEFIEFDDSIEVEKPDFVSKRPSVSESNNSVPVTETVSDGNDHFFFDDEEFEETTNTSDRELNFVVLDHPALFNGYYWEVFFISCMVLYMVVYNYGRNTCSDIAASWFRDNYEFLTANFALVGDTDDPDQHTMDALVKESESEFHIWNSGRVNCEGLLIELCLKRRQCLFHIIYNALLPNACDIIVFTVDFSPHELDPFVLCMVNKRSAARRFRDFVDISTFCSEKSKAYGEEFVVFNEIPEVMHTVCYDNRLNAFINNYRGILRALHISDKFVGIKSITEDNNPAPSFPPRRVLIFEFALKSDVPYTKLVMHFLDKISFFKLSKEGRLKSQRNRQRADEQQDKLTHQKRQDEAQQRKEERLRMETERILNETDPNKAKKLEDRQHKRNLKKRQSKAKQVIIRGL